MSGLHTPRTRSDTVGLKPPLQRPRARPYSWRWPFDEAAAGRPRLERVLTASAPWLAAVFGVLVWLALGRGGR